MKTQSIKLALVAILLFSSIPFIGADERHDTGYSSKIDVPEETVTQIRVNLGNYYRPPIDWSAPSGTYINTWFIYCGYITELNELSGRIDIPKERIGIITDHRGITFYLRIGAEFHFYGKTYVVQKINENRIKLSLNNQEKRS